MHTYKRPADRFVTPDFCQGARCGHLEGKGRAGSYVEGEEMELSETAAGVNAKPGAFLHWRNGYRYGYMLAASGEALDADMVGAPLP